jgi:hypothetical protein
MPWCAVLDVIPDPLDFTFRFWGTARRQILDQEITGKSLSTIIYGELGKLAFDQNVMVTEQRRPLFFEVVAISDSRDEITYHYLKLPLSSDGETIDRIFILLTINPDDYFRQRSLFDAIPPYGFALD